MVRIPNFSLADEQASMTHHADNPTHHLASQPAFELSIDSNQFVVCSAGEVCPCRCICTVHVQHHTCLRSSTLSSTQRATGIQIINRSVGLISNLLKPSDVQAICTII